MHCIHWASHGCEDSYCGCLGCDAAQFCRFVTSVSEVRIAFILRIEESTDHDIKLSLSFAENQHGTRIYCTSNLTCRERRCWSPNNASPTPCGCQLKKLANENIRAAKSLRKEVILRVVVRHSAGGTEENNGRSSARIGCVRLIILRWRDRLLYLLNTN